VAGNFRVVYSRRVQNSVADLIQCIARDDKDLARSVVDAVKTIDERLRENPREFGEVRYRLERLQLEMRVAVVRPIAVQFGVHVTQKIVFVSKHDLLDAPEK